MAEEYNANPMEVQQAVDAALKQQKKKKRKKRLIIIAVCFVVLIALCSSLGGSDDEENSSASVSENVDADAGKSSQAQETEISEEEYKSSCSVVAYKDIARTPDVYDGQNVKFTGQVIQVQESSWGSNTYRISVTEDEYGFWDDTVYVTYDLPDGAPNILEDDIVTFYGECKGTTSYTTVLGSQVTIPEVEAKYIDINE